MTKFSFIIPVYNCRIYLEACVNSIQMVGVSDYEILLIDDGSTDGSGQLCDELVAKFAEVRVFHQENAGVSAARNRGIQEAKGEYILFVDADDTLLPFRDDVFWHVANNVDMLVFGMEFVYYHKDNYVKKDNLTIDTTVFGSIRKVTQYFLPLFSKNYFSPVWNKMIKRSVLLKHGIYFDERLINYEDLAFSLQAMSKCESIAAVPEAYYLYRVNYDHDKTVDRIARIQDVLKNTNLIADAFWEFEEAAVADGAKSTQAIRECLLNIYFELFRVKMITAHLAEIRRYCVDFKNNENIDACLQTVHLSDGQLRWYRWIQQENSFAIWLYVRYLQLRHFCARNVKRMMGRA